MTNVYPIGLTHFHLSSQSGHALIVIGVLVLVLIYWVLKN